MKFSILFAAALLFFADRAFPVGHQVLKRIQGAQIIHWKA